MRATSGIRLSLSVRDIGGVLANLRRADAQFVEDIHVVTISAGSSCEEIARELAPKKTGFMASQIETTYTPDGFGFETGYDEQKFLTNLAGRSAPLGRNTRRSLRRAVSAPYPYFYVQELGSRRTPASPHLGPAFEEVSPIYHRDLGNALRRSTRRLGSG